MFIVKINNDGIPTTIHGNRQKLKSGSVVKGINAIDSFSFALLPSNAGFGKINDYKTLVSVYNTNQKRYEFYGRVLYSNTAMSDSGLITQDVTCESYLGFLCDSQQTYVVEQNWTVTGLLQHIIDTHNSQLEEYKHFAIGEVTVTDPNNNLYCGIQRENTWDTLKKKLIDVLGGEIRFRVVDGVTYLDYLTEIGEHRSTEIAVSKNMKSISKEKDPSAYITRLIPLGCKLSKEVTTTDEDGNETTETVETEERLDVSSVNGGVNYVDDEQAIAHYGLHIGYKEWDDVTEASRLLAKGKSWLAENNKIQIKYSITALDLSLLGLDIDDFDVCNYHPIKNALLGIDDTARIIKKTVNICEETQSTIDVGENFKTLSDLQIEQSQRIESATQIIEKIESDYVTNETLSSAVLNISSIIKQSADSIVASVSEMYVTKEAEEQFRQTVESQLQVLSDNISLRFTSMTEQIESVNGDLQTKFNQITTYFTFDIDGLTIGKVDNPYKVVIDNDRYSMLVNGVEVLWIDAVSGQVYTPELTVTDRFLMLGYLLDKDSDGNVNCEYIGG